jgi:hypothetical protein
MTDERNNRGWEASAWVGVTIVLAFIIVSGIWAGSNKSDMIAGGPASQTIGSSAASKNVTTGSGGAER